MDNLEYLPAQAQLHLHRGTKTEARISILPSMMNRKELGGQEGRYDLLLYYVIDPQDLPHSCNGCGGAIINYS